MDALAYLDSPADIARLARQATLDAELLAALAEVTREAQEALSMLSGPVATFNFGCEDIAE